MRGNNRINLRERRLLRSLCNPPQSTGGCNEFPAASGLRSLPHAQRLGASTRPPYALGSRKPPSEDPGIIPNRRAGNTRRAKADIARECLRRHQTPCSFTSPCASAFAHRRPRCTDFCSSWSWSIFSGIVSSNADVMALQQIAETRVSSLIPCFAHHASAWRIRLCPVAAVRWTQNSFLRR